MGNVENSTLTAVAGLRVGHWTDAKAQTGCTVILCPEEGCVASADVRGAAPGTRETSLLEPEKTVERIHGLVFSGGSAYGLDAASGVMRYLEERGHGFVTAFGRIPIVPAAVIYDLGQGSPRVRPGAAEGYRAAEAASAAPVVAGRVGAGAGATCGKYLGHERAQLSGLGNALLEVGGARVAALAVVNPRGDVVNPQNGEVIAGAILENGSRPTPDEVLESFDNTTLVAVATDAPLSKAQCKALAMSAHAGVARAIRPSHTVYDGDASFVLSTGTGPATNLAALAVAAQEVVALAIIEAALAANPLSPGASRL